jgi:hypothetical protein
VPATLGVPRGCLGSSYAPSDAPASNENSSLASRDRGGLRRRAPDVVAPTTAPGALPMGSRRLGVRRPAFVGTDRVCRTAQGGTEAGSGWSEMNTW